MTKRISRRAFLRTGVALAIPTILPKSVKGANDKLNIAGIGVGGKGEVDVGFLADENIVALCDVDEDRAAKTIKKFPKAKIYKDFRKMLEEEKSIDAVTVTTADHTHAVAAVLAMKMGKHVYCQKPLTRTIYEARWMAKVAKEKKVATQMGNQGHANPGSRRLVEVIQAGALGKVREVHVWTDRPIWPQGIDRPEDTPPVPKGLDWDLWLGPAPERPYHPAYVPFKWRGWWDFGTGALGDMACHIMDPVFWALKLGPPSTVEAEGDSHHPETGPRSCTIRYEFPSRGDLPPVKMTWYDGQKLPSKDLAPGIDKLPTNGAIFVGEKGTLLAYDEGVRQYKLLPEANFAGVEEKVKPTLPRSPGHHVEWIQACKGGTPGLSNFAYAAVLTEAVLLGNVAFRAGKKLEWDSANLKAANCPEAAQFIKREYRKGWEV